MDRKSQSHHRSRQPCQSFVTLTVSTSGRSKSIPESWPPSPLASPCSTDRHQRSRGLDCWCCLRRTCQELTVFDGGIDALNLGSRCDIQARQILPKLRHDRLRPVRRLQATVLAPWSVGDSFGYEFFLRLCVQHGDSRVVGCMSDLWRIRPGQELVILRRVVVGGDICRHFVLWRRCYHLQGSGWGSLVTPRSPRAPVQVSQLASACRRAIAAKRGFTFLYLILPPHSQPLHQAQKALLLESTRWADPAYSLGQRRARSAWGHEPPPQTLAPRVLPA